MSELEQLADVTRAADAEPAAELGTADAAATAGPAPHKLTPGEAWSQVPAVFGRILGRFYPEVNAIYTDEDNLAWGEAMVPLAQRYGWTVEALLEWLGPWVAFGLATEKLLTPTFQALAARVKAAKAKQAEVEDGDKPAQ